MQRITAKLRSRAGESLSETLIALLVSVLALVMLAGAISAAGNIVTRSRNAMEEYLAADAAMAGREASAKGEGTIAITVGGLTKTVDWYKNEKAEDVIAYSLAGD